MPAGLPARHQAPLRRHRLLRDLQPRQRHAGRPPEDADRGDHPARAPHARARPTRSTHRVRHRLRRHDGRAPRASTSAGAAAGRSSRSGPRGRGPTSGSTIAGFPNLFTITGPGSPSVLSNMIVSIEQHVDWIADCVDVPAPAAASATIEATVEAEDAWVEHVNEVGNIDALPAGQLLVHGREHPRQAAHLHAVHRRRRRLPRRNATRSRRRATKGSLRANHHPHPCPLPQ